MKLTFLGHAAFALEDKGTKFLIDPFITGNPRCPIKATDLQADYIFLTHGHGDHMGDTVSIAKRTGATVISTFEITEMLAEQGVKTHGMGIGGKYRFPFGVVRCTIAFHGSGISGGFPAGFLLNNGATTLYHAGDTGLCTDMELLGRLEKIDVACLPIGGNFTMDADDAVLAVEMLKAKTIVPMHYNTFPVIETDPQAFKQKVESRTPAKVAVLQPGESLTAG